ncbi:Eukaryotic translation initiation factor 3 subunit G [Ceratobasidium theobromae]|uniref:Eukaryotic translation initiation factor 3 subunit G n=1 Tax=Ceratobasidium theobromae TaxID=1582974 RepID=A0A5N5QCU6_9AGAM|nr:Eukaryotic translation initiation factor 3 subunit G [Ceratobasidium theobromae]
MSAAVAPPKASWADDVDDFGDLPQNSDTIDENGIRTIIEYSINDEGKRIKTTRKIKRTLKKALVDHATAERKLWVKFGNERGNKPGPDRATTTVGEALGLKLSAGPKNAEPEPDPDAAAKAALGGKKILCRVCQGDHFTTKCPYKETLGLGGGDDMPPPEDGPAARPEQPAGNKYVPPSMRGGPGAGRGGESMYRTNRDDLPTLRVTNVSEDTQEDDLRDLFSKFGRVIRVYIGRDRETGVGKGYAFVSFEDRANAERAMQKVNGMGYDNLILSVQWSQPREPRAS